MDALLTAFRADQSPVGLSAPQIAGALSDGWGSAPPQLRIISTISSGESANCHVSMALCIDSGRLLVLKEHLNQRDGHLHSHVLRECVVHCMLRDAEHVGEDREWRLQRCICVMVATSTTRIVFEHVPHSVERLFVAQCLPAPTARRYVRDVATALVQLRDTLGAAHRDVKMHNMCIDARGRAVLIDFDSASRVRLSAKHPVSTITVRAPEALRLELIEEEEAAVPVDVFAADMWSLGCLWVSLLLWPRSNMYAPDDWQSASSMLAACSKFVKALADGAESIDARVRALSRAAGERDIEHIRGMLHEDASRRPTLETLLASTR